jgi:hypothetical protein
MPHPQALENKIYGSWFKMHQAGGLVTPSLLAGYGPNFSSSVLYPWALRLFEVTGMICHNAQFGYHDT